MAIAGSKQFCPPLIYIYTYILIGFDPSPYKNVRKEHVSRRTSSTWSAPIQCVCFDAFENPEMQSARRIHSEDLGCTSGLLLGLFGYKTRDKLECSNSFQEVGFPSLHVELQLFWRQEEYLPGCQCEVHWHIQLELWMHDRKGWLLGRCEVHWHIQLELWITIGKVDCWGDVKCTDISSSNYGCTIGKANDWSLIHRG